MILMNIVDNITVIVTFVTFSLKKCGQNINFQQLELLIAVTYGSFHSKLN